MKTLCIVIPCYNEEDVLPITVDRINTLLSGLIGAEQVASDSHALFVDDGSRDKTWAMIETFAGQLEYVRGLKLSRNRGHQFAVMAGMMEAEGDLIVSIDADLQDDVDAIAKMVSANLEDGAEVVYGVRSARDTDTAFKRMTAQGFYRFMEGLGVEVVYNHADFRLLSRRAVETLREFEERNLFLRGLMPMLGYKSAVVEYERSERVAGESKYPIWKMLSLAWEGVTSLSVRPLRLITSAGAVVAFLAFLGALASVVQWALGETVSGWTSVIVAVMFLGGVQLLALGIIGEYVGKVYSEVKRRPRYIVERKVS